MPSELISLSWGPWLALAGAAVIVVSSRIAGAEEPDAVSTEVDWFARSEQTEHARASGTAAEVWASPAAGSGSVPPPS